MRVAWLCFAVVAVVFAGPTHAQTPGRPHPVAASCTGRTVPDFTGDGRADVAGIDGQNNLRLYVGDGAGHVTGGALMWPAGGLWGGFKTATAADFDSDGKADLATIDPYGELRLWPGDGTGHVTGVGPNMWPSGGYFAAYRFMVAGDFTGDGQADLAGADGANNMRLFVGDGTGHVSGGALMWPANGGWGGFVDVVAADFTGDGNVDIAGITPGHDMALYLGDGAGNLIVPNAGPAMWPTGGLWNGFTHLVAADFDADGAVDIAGINAYHDLGWYRGDGTGHLVTAGAGALMWPAGGQWAGHRLITATASSACWTGRVIVMPLGDSITYGTSSSTGDGYRAPLAVLLDVGSPMGAGWMYEGGLSSGQRWWSHGGHVGWTIDMLRAQVPAWLPVARNAGLPVTLVLLDAGTNDAAQNRTSAQMLTSMSALLDALLAAAPGVKVMVAQITITTWETPAQQTNEAAFDTGLPTLAATKGPQVAVVDMRGVALSPDGVHPGDAGYADMANRWHTALSAAGLAALVGPHH